MCETGCVGELTKFELESEVCDMCVCQIAQKIGSLENSICVPACQAIDSVRSGELDMCMLVR